MSSQSPFEPHTEEEVVERAPEVDESALGECEPWDSWETKLVWWSIGIGIAGLIVLGAIINVTILK